MFIPRKTVSMLPQEQRSMVKKFVFQTYEKIKYKSRKYDDVFCFAKLFILSAAIVVSGLVYVIFVTKASTHGYFYRVEANKVEQIKFEYNLVKLKVLEKREKLRKEVNFTRGPNQTVGVNTKIVKVDSETRLAQR